MILNDLACCLHNFVLMVHAWSLKSHMQVMNRGVPWKSASGAESPVLQVLQFQ
jgi:hypothetical protein